MPDEEEVPVMSMPIRISPPMLRQPMSMWGMSRQYGEELGLLLRRRTRLKDDDKDHDLTSTRNSVPCGLCTSDSMTYIKGRGIVRRGRVA